MNGFLGRLSEIQIFCPAEGHNMTSHPRGVEMFSSGEVYSLRVLDPAIETEQRMVLPITGHQLARRDS